MRGFSVGVIAGAVLLAVCSGCGDFHFHYHALTLAERDTEMTLELPQLEEENDG